MGASVDNVFIQTYERTVRHLAQQGITRLRPWVDERSVQSEGHNWERLGSNRFTGIRAGTQASQWVQWGR